MTIFTCDDELSILAERSFRQINGHILIMPIRVNSLNGVYLIVSISGRVQLNRFEHTIILQIPNLCVYEFLPLRHLVLELLFHPVT